ncbi:MAG: hypothetical protein ACO3E1_08355 [Flavobacteriales bacterium]
MRNFKAIIDGYFGENYSSTYFDGNVVKSNYKTIQNENAMLIYSSKGDKYYLNLIVSREKGKGHGTQLLNLFKEIIAADFYVETWLYEGNTGLIKWLENNGGQVIKVVKDFWLADSISENYSCSICGYPCRCTMVLYHVKNSRKE